MPAAPREFSVGRVREWLSLLREATILLAVLVLLLWPGAITPVIRNLAHALSDAGAKTLNLAGATFDLGAIKRRTEDGLLNGRQVDESLGAVLGKLDAVQRTLGEGAPAGLDEAIRLLGTSRDRLGFVNEQIKLAGLSADAIDADVVAGGTDGSGEAGLKGLGSGASAPGVASDGAVLALRIAPWAVVFGADRHLDAARVELARARSAGFPDAVLFRREGWFRAALPFATETDAKVALPRVWERLRDGAYVREMRAWCPVPVADPSGDYLSCP